MAILLPGSILDYRNLGNLTTTVNNKVEQNDLNDVNKEIDNLKKSVSDGKSSIASAITAKGVATGSDATFKTIVDNIEKIPSTRSRTLQIRTWTANGPGFTEIWDENGKSIYYHYNNTEDSHYGYLTVN